MTPFAAASEGALSCASTDMAERVRELASTAAALVALAEGPQLWSCCPSGLAGVESSDASALALQTLLQRQPWVVTDCLEDSRLELHPAVIGTPWLRRLAGFPVLACDGRVLGCLCALDFEPGAFAPQALENLSRLADTVAVALERRDLGRDLRRLRQRGRFPRAELQQLFEPTAGGQGPLPRQVCLHALEALFRLRATAGVALLRLECLGVDRYLATIGLESFAALMEVVAARIRAELPSEASFCIFGEEEFLLLVPRISDPAALRTLAARLVAGCSAPYRIGGHSLPLPVAVGASLLDGSALSLGSVLSELGVARRFAAACPSGGFHLVDAGMWVQVREDFARQSRLREGMDQGALLAFFQPIVDLSSGRPRGFEALARWRCEDGQLQVPADFLPVACQIGLTGELDLAVIRQVLAALPAMASASAELVETAPDGEANPLLMSVNLSAQLLESPELCERLLAMLRASPAPPGWRLQVEILEESLQVSDPRFDAFLSRLVALGVGIAIDDFGTGYSSLARLHTLPIQAFKIDRSFVERIDDQIAPSNQLLRTMKTLATDLGLSATAEGVASLNQCEWLRRTGFLSGQGYHFSQPLSLEQALAYLRSHVPPRQEAAPQAPAVPQRRAGLWWRPGLPGRS